VEAALLVGPQPGQRSGAEHVRRRAARLEVADADRARRNQVPAGLGEDRRHVAVAARVRAVEKGLSAGRRQQARRPRRGAGGTEAAASWVRGETARTHAARAAWA